MSKIVVWEDGGRLSWEHGLPWIVEDQLDEPGRVQILAACHSEREARLLEAALAKEGSPPVLPLGEEQYPCRECGVLRTKAEGGTTFTVCDECWDAKELAEPQPVDSLASERRE